jgi:hypothetical protein
MQGDFTRGHRPDGKRGQRFTRALMQQRRLLLDSDVNALVDALHERLRDLASDLGCPKGSPDLGFLVTPGSLLAIFETLTDVVIDENNVTVYRDYSRKFLDRFPSVFIAADQGVVGAATLRLRAAADGDVRFWCRSEAATTVELPGGIVLNVPAGDPFQPVDVNLAGPLEEIRIDLQAGEQIWIALIEQLQAAGTDPQFSVAAGRFYLDGLPLANAADRLYYAVSFPLDPATLLTSPAPPALADGDHVIAFLEGWERHITAVEDPGLLERALGGDVDTTTRGQAVGQVKLVRPPAGPLDVEALARAICDPLLPTGTLEVTTPPAPPDPDPCALPVEGGYTGPDNRFYRFEVHQGGSLGNAILKWSRDNGSELFRAISAPAANRLIFASNTALRAGDLVEVLNEAVDLGDQAAAAFIAGAFQRPEQAVGPLALLETASGPLPANGVAFVLRQVSGAGDVNLDPDIFGPFTEDGPAIKVRRWHGLIETQVGTTEYTLEHGIEIELSGEFAARDYWQYEARVLGENANGPFQTSPHGPLRAFAPLALLQFVGAGQPLVLEQWLDHRFSPLCELNADDIAFDGERVGAEGVDTVQEALEELFEREAGGCCEFTLQPVDDDAAARIRAILEESDGEVTICLEPGVYPFRTTLEIEGRKVVLKGCPRAVIEADAGAQPTMHVRGRGRLRLEELIVFGPGPQDIDVFVELDPDAGGIEAHAVGFLNGRSALPSTQTAIRVAGRVPQPVDPNNPALLEDIPVSDEPRPEVDLEACVFVGGFILSAPQLSSLRFRDSVCYCLTGGVSVDTIIALEMVSVRIGVVANLGAAAEWTAQQLLTEGDELLDQLPAFSTIVPDNPATACVQVGIVGSGCIERCEFIAGFGVVCTEIRTTRFEKNFYRVGMAGLYIIVALEALVQSEHIRLEEGVQARFGIAIVLAAGPLGGVLQPGAGVSVSGCIINGPAVGISLAGEGALPFARTLIGVRVSENQITASSMGIQIGPGTEERYPGMVTGVAVEDNEIRAGDVGVVANGRLIPFVFGEASSLPYAEVRVAANWVLAARGILVIGSRFEISDNRIRLLPGANPRFGVFAVDSNDPVIESNLIERSQTEQSPANSAAFFLARGSRARLAGNVVRASPPLTGLYAEAHPEMRVTGNDFGPGESQLMDVDDLIFRDNRTQGRVRVQNTDSGQLVANRFASFQGDSFPGSLIIEGMQGSWQVNSNKADFGIDIRPAVEPNFVFTPRGFTVLDPNQPIFVSDWIGLRDIAFRSADEGFAAELDVFAGRGTGGGAGPGVLPESAESILAVDNLEWASAWREGVTNLIIRAVGEAAAEFDPPLVAVPVTQVTERPYQALIEGNWSGTLQVGHTGTGVQPATQSVVQVIGNRAQFLLFVQDYRRRVVVHNASDFYAGVSVQSQAAAIQGPNLDT